MGVDSSVVVHAVCIALSLSFLVSFSTSQEHSCGKACSSITDCSDNLVCNPHRRCDDNPEVLVNNPPLCTSLNCRDSFVFPGPTIDQDRCQANLTYQLYSCSPPIKRDHNFAILYYFDLVNEGVAKCNKKHYAGSELVAAISTGWFNRGAQCFENVTITATNGRSVVATIVDECVSTSGCTGELYGYGPCSPMALSGTKGVWDALGMNISVGIIDITWNFTNPISGKGRNSHTAVIVASSVGGGACLVVLLVGCWIFKYRTRKQDWLASNLEKCILPQRFNYAALSSATNGFDKESKLGEGGFGPVFKGKLSDGTWIAVKRVGSSSKQGLKQFKAEVTSIGKICHINLVKLVGFSIQSPQNAFLLAYEYLSNGSLDKWIFDDSKVFPWRVRVSIAQDVANGLNYLHNSCRDKIIHLDIKPQNILLDENMTAKISDFGLAKLMHKEKNHTLTAIRGTKGYMAPEWLRGRVTEKTDVYSYGVLLLELISCKRLYMLLEGLDEINDIESAIDLKGNCIDKLELEKLIKIGLLCMRQDPSARPSMGTILKWLEDLQSLNLPNPNSLTDWGCLTSAEHHSIIIMSTSALDAR